MERIDPRGIMFLEDIAAALNLSNPGSAHRTVLFHDFPRPVLDVNRHRFWNKAEVEAWIASHPEKVRR